MKIFEDFEQMLTTKDVYFGKQDAYCEIAFPELVSNIDCRLKVLVQPPNVTVVLISEYAWLSLAGVSICNRCDSFSLRLGLKQALRNMYEHTHMDRSKKKGQRGPVEEGLMFIDRYVRQVMHNAGIN